MLHNRVHTNKVFILSNAQMNFSLLTAHARVHGGERRADGRETVRVGGIWACFALLMQTFCRTFSWP